MDFKDSIRQLSDRILKMRDSVQTEEATKTAFIMPFIDALGYDVFNPAEVCPEYTCDIGTKKGEKIDYAIMKEGDTAILIECKHCLKDLNLHSNQLLRYFNVSKAKFGVLTNGVIYKFYTDLEKENVMDSRPFLEVNLLDIRDGQVDELKKFHKSYFDIDNIINTASELKYTTELKNLINAEFSNPEQELVRYFSRKVYDGQLTAKVMTQFTGLLKGAMSQWKSDLVNDRIKTALASSEQQEAQKDADSEESIGTSVSVIVTTEEELQGFYIVKSILYGQVPDINKVTHRDTQSYFGILYDDNNRQPICRLHLNGGKKYVEVFPEEKKGVKHPLNGLDDIYQYAQILIETVKRYSNE